MSRPANPRVSCMSKSRRARVCTLLFYCIDGAIGDFYRNTAYRHPACACCTYGCLRRSNCWNDRARSARSTPRCTTNAHLSSPRSPLHPSPLRLRFHTSSEPLIPRSWWPVEICWPPQATASCSPPPDRFKLPHARVSLTSLISSHATNSPL